MHNRVSVVTLNIHKGVCIRNKRYVLPEIRRELHSLNPDLVFLQEVQGNHTIRAKRFSDWADASQEQYLAQGCWQYTIYGQNASYVEGHHGNSILSRFPIEQWHNFDVSTSSFERRGILYAVVRPEAGKPPLHCFCVHFDLRPAGRLRQFAELARRIRQHVPPSEAVVVAGDFNDPAFRSHAFMRPLGLMDAFSTRHGRPARTFPAPFPLLSLDRIYCRPDALEEASVLNSPAWRKLSDHFPVYGSLLTESQGAYRGETSAARRTSVVSD